MKDTEIKMLDNRKNIENNATKMRNITGEWTYSITIQYK